MKLSKRSKFMILYAIFIAIGLIYILFIADDKMFQKKNSNANTNKLITYEDKKEELLKNNYKYHYDIIIEGNQYKCSGEKKAKTDIGTCKVKDITIEYNEKDYEEKLKDLNLNYLNVNYIFNKIDSIEPTVSRVSTLHLYKYDTTFDDKKGDITVYTDNDRITQITIGSASFIYVLYFDK